MAKTRLIAVNGSGGAFVAVSATSVTRRVEIIEDGSANAGVGQGLQIQFDDGFGTVPNVPNTANTYTVEPVSEPFTLGEPIPQGAGYGRVIGTPPDNSGGYSIPATPLANVRSASATATIIRVNEYA
jgi:hypothetical protein